MSKVVRFAHSSAARVDIICIRDKTSLDNTVAQDKQPYINMADSDQRIQLSNFLYFRIQITDWERRWYIQ